MKRIILIVFMVLAAVSCARRPLLAPSNTHYIKIYIDEDIKNVTTGFYNPDYLKPPYSRPEIMRVALYDVSTGQLLTDQYLKTSGDDEGGHYYSGYVIADPGHYRMLAYSIGTETTMIRGNDYTAEAYTEIYDPDDLFVVNCSDLIIPYTDKVDTLKAPSGEYFVAESIVKSYYLQIKIEGIQWLSSASAVLSGVAGSAFLNGDGPDLSNESTILFDMYNGGKATDVADTDILYTTFGTFGKIPDVENELKITFDLLTISGQLLSVSLDITEEFAKPDAIEHQWLLINRTIVIPDPPAGTGGGLNPDVNDWGDINVDIII